MGPRPLAPSFVLTFSLACGPANEPGPTAEDTKHTNPPGPPEPKPAEEDSPEPKPPEAKHPEQDSPDPKPPEQDSAEPKPKLKIDPNNPPVCAAGIAKDAACTTNEDMCQIKGNWRQCGVMGYRCENHKWRELVLHCNPPGVEDHDTE